MQRIGIVDDRKENRESFSLSIHIALKHLDRDWKVIDTYPFMEQSDYINWIMQNEVAVLLLDERLEEEPSEEGLTVNYRGHQLIGFLRERLKELPIYVITAFKDDADLQEKFKDFDGIISREDFERREEEYLTQILRAGNRFLTENANQLEQISALSRKIAIGESSPDDVSLLSSLQIKLELPHLNSEIVTKKEWLDSFQSSVDDLEDLKNRINSFLNKKDS